MGLETIGEHLVFGRAIFENLDLEQKLKQEPSLASTLFTDYIEIQLSDRIDRIRVQ